ncbi:cytochrome P450 [Armillaria nabsnona]|nr:cytochrome P450 [Armillaria nabsnona]
MLAPNFPTFSRSFFGFLVFYLAMAFAYFPLLDVFCAITALVIIRRILQPRLYAPLPPGPAGLPLVGNILDMPADNEWLTFAKWGELYGDISSVTVLGQTMIILNSARAAVDMLDKKSAIYSDRPTLQMGGELVGWKNTLVLLPYGDRFRRYRRIFYSLIGSQATMKQYHPPQELETRRFLRRVLSKPEELAAHVRKTAGAVVLRISHGYEVKENDDPFVRLADQATEQFSAATKAGAFIVDLVPALRYVPDWFPGAGFKQRAKAWAATLQEMVEQPHNFVKQQVAAGTAVLSFTSSMLESKPLSAEEEFDLKWSSASLYSGAADTTVSSIYALFLAMALFPDVAKKAQAEIDAVVGNDRLPTFADREHLPYVDALAKEVLRWNTVVPTGVPHRVVQDDIHTDSDGNTYFIPKGALVVANIWKLTHDSRMYTNPMDFNPDRFIPSEGRTTEPDPGELCFGFGRRICPGLHLADASVFISCAMSLAVFDISKCVENGVVVEPLHEQTSGTISHPKPFKCDIKPRSHKAVSLIQADEMM